MVAAAVTKTTATMEDELVPVYTQKSQRSKNMDRDDDDDDDDNDSNIYELPESREELEELYRTTMQNLNYRNKELKWRNRVTFNYQIISLVLFVLCFVFLILIALLAAGIIKPAHDSRPERPCSQPDGFVHSFEEVIKTIDTFTCPKALDILQSLYLERASKCWNVNEWSSQNIHVVY